MSAAAVVSLLLAVWSPEPVVGRASVIDGDTLDVHGQRVRIWGIDAPEGRQTCERDGRTWRCGSEAANRLDRFIADRPVSCREIERDRYHRIVARCTVGGRDLGGWMISNGWAVRYARYAGSAYVAEERRARSGRLGIWSGEFIQPRDWRGGAR